MSASPSPEPSPVRIVDIKMPFFSMVAFMVKWAIAAIPAIIILATIGGILAGILGGILSGHSQKVV